MNKQHEQCDTTTTNHHINESKNSNKLKEMKSISKNPRKNSIN